MALHATEWLGPTTLWEPAPAWPHDRISHRSFGTGAHLVLESFSTHRQLRFWQREAGGQLFGRLDGSRIEVLEATGPRRTDRRTRTTYVPDRRAEQREIDDRFGRGLHFIGDWHSHPEKIPVPSYRDVSSLDDTVRRSSHSMLGLVLVIVGQLAAPEGLHVSIFHGDGAAVELKPHPPLL